MHTPKSEMPTVTGKATAGAPPLIVPKLRVLFSNGELQAEDLVLDVGELALGRCTGLESIEGDSAVSRLHAQLRMEQAARDAAPTVEIVDCGSHNGTFVNGERVLRCRLRDNDVVRIGDSLLHLRYEPEPEDSDVPGMVGQSYVMARVRVQLSRAALSAAPLLLEGDTGTGKEVAAQALHKLRHEQGRRGPLVPVNCSAIPATLAESELFGHVRGAFSGASDNRTGHLAAASGGTLFLDEIGEMPLELQPKLLRALEENKVTPVGGNRSIDCDLRLVAATNRALDREVRRGRFRADLYGRIAALTIKLPPLRARREDVLLLLSHLWGGPPPPLSADLAQQLLLHPWPRNVRELRNVIGRLRLMVSSSGELALDPGCLSDLLPQQGDDDEDAPAMDDPGQDGPLHRPAGPARSENSRQLRLEPPLKAPPISREQLDRMMRQYRGVIARVAEQVGRSRRQVRRWLLYYGLSVEDYLP